MTSIASLQSLTAMLPCYGKRNANGCDFEDAHTEMPFPTIATH
jgi:hypothetical protein